MVILLVLIEMVNADIGGCIFCSEKGSGDLINYNKDIQNQVINYFEEIIKILSLIFKKKKILLPL